MPFAPHSPGSRPRCDILRIGDTLQRIPAARFLEDIGVGGGAGFPGLRAHRARRDRVRADAELAIFDGDQLGEMQKTGLGV